MPLRASWRKPPLTLRCCSRCMAVANGTEKVQTYMMRKGMPPFVNKFDNNALIMLY